MNKRERKLLEGLRNGLWHEALPKGIGAGTVNRCIEKGLVTCRAKVIREQDGYQDIVTMVRITRAGRKALWRV